MKNPIPCLPVVFLSGVSLLALGACAEVSPAASTPVPAAPAAAAVPGAIKYAPPATVTITPSRTTALPARAAVTSGVIDTTKLRTTPNAVGSRTDVILGGPSGTLNNFESHITTVNPGQSAHPPHIHAHEEMLLVKEGVLEVYIAGKTYIAGPGSIIYYGPNDPHGTKSIGDVPAVYYVFTWSTDKTEQPDTTRPAGIEIP